MTFTVFNIQFSRSAVVLLSVTVECDASVPAVVLLSVMVECDASVPLSISSHPHLRVSQSLVCEMLDIKEECLPLYGSGSLSFLFMTTRTITGNNNVVVVGVIFWRLLISFITGGRHSLTIIPNK